ncbi:MBL fold metallo-hydrolase [Halotia branconii]|uniref:MBL fold metallo-hydrolase n=1 Tax=Halotia branconii CENA392 TaxID=1539056 RepID=A0AAJ6NVG9_9CYAN|nr:MBL fold metallo-hydrolase [Halotia branconii]WGV27153.1 MBL fold metallo-hydrolase [Halotia branconii CENA392]
MQIDMIGHATLFVETKDCKILMDPVLWDPFCEGLNESCPKREVMADKLSNFDFLVISHQHLDHFDIRSLAYLPKTVDVLIPQDRLIEDCLRHLGYSHIYPLADFTKVRSGSTTLMATRSEVRVPEFGMVFADDSGVFWNTVDTYFSPETIQKVRKFFPEIDFLLTTWHISMEGKFQYNQSISFPFELYSYLFYLISLIQPQAIAPGAQGFKYIGESAWQNQVVFPVTRERFCHDLKTAFPELADKIFPIDPGDILTFDGGKYDYIRGKSNYAQMLVDNRESIDFNPVAIANTLIDSNPENYSLEDMRQIIEEKICLDLPQFIIENRNSLFTEHCQWQIVYQIEITFPDGVKTWNIDLSEAVIQTKQGRNPLANLFTYITASTLYSLIDKKRDWDYLLCSGDYRTFHKIYSISKEKINFAETATFVDPIQLQFPSSYVASNNIYRELAKWMPANESISLTEDEASMICLGNLLIKRKNRNKDKEETI